VLDSVDTSQIFLKLKKNRSALLHKCNAGTGIFVLDLMEINQTLTTSREEDGLGAKALYQ
jgi:hypothetical protein